MSLLYIIFGIIAISIPTGLCIYYRIRIKDSYPKVHNAYEFLKQMGKNRFDVHMRVNFGTYNAYYFQYEGYQYTGVAQLNGYELTLDVLNAATINYSPEMLDKIRIFCNEKSKEADFMYATYTRDIDANTISVDIRSGLIYPNEDSFWFLIDAIMQQVKNIRASVKSLEKPENIHPKTAKNEEIPIYSEIFSEIGIPWELPF